MGNLHPHLVVPVMVGSYHTQQGEVAQKSVGVVVEMNYYMNVGVESNCLCVGYRNLH